MAPNPVPDGLREPGRALWCSIADPVDAWSLHAGELAILERACRVADRLADLDRAYAGLTTLVARGYVGQEVEHPVLKSLVAAEALLVRLLAALKLPDLTAAPGARSSSASARDAARARWDKPRSG